MLSLVASLFHETRANLGKHGYIACWLTDRIDWVQLLNKHRAAI